MRKRLRKKEQKNKEQQLLKVQNERDLKELEKALAALDARYS